MSRGDQLAARASTASGPAHTSTASGPAHTKAESTRARARSHAAADPTEASADAAPDGVFVADDFAEAVLYVVSRIPPGRVMTYGGVAAVLGSRAARAVGTVMARSGADSPWWRVVRADGQAPQGHEAAALEHYRAEGTPVREASAGYRVLLREARWRG